MKKNIKQKFNSAMKILFAIITLITSFGYTSLALALKTTVNKGDVVDSSYSTGSINNEGDVKFTKKGAQIPPATSLWQEEPVSLSKTYSASTGVLVRSAL